MFHRLAQWLMLLLTAPTAPTLLATQPRTTEPPQVISIQALRYAFFAPEIHVKRGAPVILEVTAADVRHGFNLPDFGVRADLSPGKTVRIRLTPNYAGRFVFFCDVFCGEGHDEMSGTLVVEAS